MKKISLTRFYDGKKVLVTGGAGFIGSHLVEMLVELGALVKVPVRKTTRLNFLTKVKRHITIIEADLFDRKSVDLVIKNQDIVVHLAAAKGGGIAHSIKHHGSLFRDNMLSSINVLDAARCQSISRLLVVSSACVYPRDSISPIPEEEGFRGAPEPTNAGYGWSKRMSEQMALWFKAEYGMNIGIVRPFNAYGPRDDFFKPTNHVIPGIIERTFDGENPLAVWGTGKQTRSFLYVTDFVRGLLLACANEQVTGPLNLGSDEEITIADLARLIVKLSGKTTHIIFDSSKPDGQPRRSCDTRSARQMIGFQAKIPLNQGLKKTIEWYIAEKELRGKNR